MWPTSQRLLPAASCYLLMAGMYWHKLAVPGCQSHYSCLSAPTRRLPTSTKVALGNAAVMGSCGGERGRPGAGAATATAGVQHGERFRSSSPGAQRATPKSRAERASQPEPPPTHLEEGLHVGRRAEHHDLLGQGAGRRGAGRLAGRRGRDIGRCRTAGLQQGPPLAVGRHEPALRRAASWQRRRPATDHRHRSMLGCGASVPAGDRVETDDRPPQWGFRLTGVVGGGVQLGHQRSVVVVVGSQRGVERISALVMRVARTASPTLLPSSGP